MAFNAFTVAAKLDADASGVARGVGDAEGHFGKLGGIARTAGLAVAAGLALGAGAAVKLGVDAIGAASDLAETESKIKQLFGGKNAALLGKWADDSATKLGLSRQAALEAAAGFGDMFSQLGQSAPEAVKTSEKVVQLAADLGSFNNLDTEDVSNRISAAFRGEYDSLQALIPNINAARVEKEALAESGKKNAAELTAEEKAMAALKIITEDGAKAQGDFARTSDGLANQQKTLSANFENLQATIGEKLLPVATALVTWANEKMLPAAKELGEWLRDNLGPILARVAEFITDKVIPAAQDFFHWFMEVILPDVKRSLTPVLEGLRDAFEKIAEKVKENEPELIKLRDAFQTVIEFLWDKVMPVVGQILGDKLSKMGDAIGGAITIIGGIVTAFDAVVTAIQAVVDWISKISWPDPPDWLKDAWAAGGSLLPRTVTGGSSAVMGSGNRWQDFLSIDIESKIVKDDPFDKYDRGRPIVVNFHGPIDPDASAKQLIKLLERYGAVRGTNGQMVLP